MTQTNLPVVTALRKLATEAQLNADRSRRLVLPVTQSFHEGEAWAFSLAAKMIEAGSAEPPAGETFDLQAADPARFVEEDR